tara:strand:- start:95 stop:520 length:426 start_codon:yes stop_codon:yes gene_type:complete
MAMVGLTWEIHSFTNQRNGETLMATVLVMMPMETKATPVLKFEEHQSLTAWDVEIPMAMVGQTLQTVGLPTPTVQQTHSLPNRFNGEILMVMDLATCPLEPYVTIVQIHQVSRSATLKVVLIQMETVGRIRMENLLLQWQF